MRAVIRNSVIVFMLMVGISAAVFCDDTVVVRAEPQKEVASIEYQLSKSIELYEQGDGIWTEDEMGHSFFEYQFYTDMLGNKLIVNYTDKTQNIYTYKICPYTDSEGNKYDIIAYSDEEGNIINDREIKKRDTQDEKPWDSVGTYYETIEYKGATTSIPVHVVANPVESISFIPAKRIEFKEDEWSMIVKDADKKDYKVYICTQYEEGNKLILKNKDKTTTTYTCKKDVFVDGYNAGMAFVDDKGNGLGQHKLILSDNQANEHWFPNNTYYVTIHNCGKTTKVAVRILPLEDKPVAVKVTKAELEKKKYLKNVKKPIVESVVKLPIKRKIKITLKNTQKNISGYEVRVFTKKSNAKKNRNSITKKIVKGKKKSFTIKSNKIQNKKVMYIRMRSYKVIAGHRVYSNKWSSIKRVTIK